MNRPVLASRTDSFAESVIREMTRLGDETGAIPLAQGLPDFDPPPEVLAAARESLEAGDNQYTFPFGLSEFRDAIAERYLKHNSVVVDPETEITVTCGVSEALVATVIALTDPGDEVIILEPWYENYLPACLISGAKARFVSLTGEGFDLPREALREACSKRTRLILINSPHNPTGRVLSHDDIGFLAELCLEHDIILVADEIYEYILYEGHEHVSASSLPSLRDRSVTISGLSKSYAVTGWRVGWAIAHPRLTSAIRKVHDYLTVCAPSVFQRAGIAALELPNEYYVQLRQAYDDRRGLLLGALDAIEVPYFAPQGAYYIMANFATFGSLAESYSREDWHPDRAFAEFMAREVGVGVVPGSSFYFGAPPPGCWARINFAKTTNTLGAARERLEGHFSNRLDSG